MKRTNTCGELTDKDIGKNVLLNGWVHSRRDHGGVIFIDLRDRYGLSQLVFNAEFGKEAHVLADSLRREDVIHAEGQVRARGQGLENPNLFTGKIEVFANKLIILNKAETPPIEIDDRVETNEDIGLKYRYLELRKPGLQRNLILRHRITQTVRNYFDKQGFIDVETPIPAKSTPEGARDYLVPSRVHPGKFYALPQSPQLFKQLLMVAGYDRYIQIAKCFRDEDLRADRQPEFTQIDIEMSFLEEEDIYNLMDGMIKEIWKSTIGYDVQLPIQRITYKEAMDRFGSDKPDMRFGMELCEAGDILKDSDFQVFSDTMKNDGIIKAINVKKGAEFSRKDIDSFIEFAKIYKAKGLAWIKVSEDGKLESSIVKFLSDEIQRKLKDRLKGEPKDLLLLW